MIRKTVFTGALVSAVLGAGVVAGPAAAGGGGEPEYGGDFSCRASALRLSGPSLLPMIPNTLEPITSNKEDVPCVDDTSDVLETTTLGPLTAALVNTKTDADPDDEPGAFASASIAKAVLGTAGVPAITADVLQSEASVSCVDGEPYFQSDGRVVLLKIAGNEIALPQGGSGSDSMNLDVLGLIKINLNEVTTTDTSITRRAVHVFGLGLDLVVAESKANVEDNPCPRAAEKPECSDGKDNDGDYKVDARDPGCINDGKYDPDDDDETDKDHGKPDYGKPDYGKPSHKGDKGDHKAKKAKKAKKSCKKAYGSSRSAGKQGSKGSKKHCSKASKKKYGKKSVRR